MNEFEIIDPKDVKDNVFSTIGKEWLLVAAKRGEQTNAMTASWGAMGVLWNKPAAFVFIRPQRYTKEFADASPFLSLSVLGGAYRKELNYFGTVSGRDEPKIERSGLTLRLEDGIPFFDEAKTVFLCRKLYAQDLRNECFFDETIPQSVYPQNDFHTMYVCEIQKILARRPL